MPVAMRGRCVRDVFARASFAVARLVRFMRLRTDAFLISRRQLAFLLQRHLLSNSHGPRRDTSQKDFATTRFGSSEPGTSERFGSCHAPYRNVRTTTSAVAISEARREPGAFAPPGDISIKNDAGVKRGRRK